MQRRTGCVGRAACTPSYSVPPPESTKARASRPPPHGSFQSCTQFVNYSTVRGEVLHLPNTLGLVVSTGLEPQTDVNVKYIASMYGVYTSSYCLATSTNATTPLQLMLWSESRHEFNQLAWYWPVCSIYFSLGGVRIGFLFVLLRAPSFPWQLVTQVCLPCPLGGWLREKGRNASFESISNAPSLFAEAVVNRIRLGDPEWQIECGDSNYGGAIVRGEVWEMAICTVPCWEWLIFPLTIIFLAMILLMGAQVQTLLTGPGNLSQL
ncbi:hypothetical protein OOU_Y34scaffold00565g6 [Pyricularia oryzae Y34]|uniref:Uncharacterized protein n=2 Tax=Pyricularia oryzae TaxID=318829 RepID=A0AA97NX46_PYRO3|nr:hypothetical protein OOU_Y34scaffold00565g6 [Pyricularia oryzae Y34]